MEAVSEAGHSAIAAPRSSAVGGDLSDAGAVGDLFRDVDPEAVIHAAALTSIEACERHPSLAERTNHVATQNVVAALKPTVRLLFVSTDQVYADEPGVKSESDPPDPVNAYGRSKLGGESAARLHENAVVVRCNMFGPSRTPGKSSLSDWICESLASRKPTDLFTDALFSPLHFKTLAAILVEIVAGDLVGTFNIGCREGRSKRDFAHLVARHLGLPLAETKDAVSTNVRGRARRPRDLRLDVTRIEAHLGRSMPTLEEEVAKL